MQEFYDFLEANYVAYDRHDHPAVFTVEESDRLVPKLPGAKTKNLFLRDHKGKRHFLVMVPSDKQVNLKGLTGEIGIKRIGFASPQRLQKYLDLEPGAVSPMAVYNDKGHDVEVFFDQALWDSDAFQFHPLVNTSTIVITRENMERFLKATGHEYKIIQVPERKV